MSEDFKYVEVELNDAWSYDSSKAAFYSYKILTSIDYIKNSWTDGAFTSDGAGIKFAMSCKDIKALDFVKYEYYARIKHPEDIEGSGSKFCSEYDLVALPRDDENGEARVVYRHSKASDNNNHKVIDNNTMKRLETVSLL